MTIAVKPGHEARRVLQLGYGAFGPVHARAWLAHGFAGRLVVADPSAQARARAARDLTGARIVEDWHAELGHTDIVDIVTPADCHPAHIAAALDAGCDVLVEKPLTLGTPEARAVSAQVMRSRGLLQVGWLMRAHPLAQALRRVVADKHSPPLWIDADFTSLKRPRRDSGVLLNDAVHFIDLACWLVGRLPEEVTAVLRYPLGRDFDDIALVTLGFAGGAVARIAASCVLAGEVPDPVVPGGWSRKSMTVYTGTNRFEADFMTGVLRTAEASLAPDGNDGWRTRYEPRPPLCLGDVSWDVVMAAQIAGFLESVASRMPPDAGVASGHAATAICEAARRSALEKRTLRLEL